MSSLKAGFSRVNINPPMGINLRGYFIVRLADGILDDLEVNVLALQCGDVKTLLVSADLCSIENDLSAFYRKNISEATGVPEENIIIAATHTHTAPNVLKESDDELIVYYTDFVGKRMVDAAKFALDDLKGAKMGYGMGTAPNIAFIRRYVMKDGSVKTNPGVNNPDIVGPVGETDESVNVMRFDREGGDTLVFVNFANHPDVVGGCKVSADWPGILRSTVEKILDNTKCIFFNGAQGDVNHVNVHPTGGFLNDMFMDFDDVSRGYAHARYIARVVTGGVLQAYDKVNYVDVNSIVSKQKYIYIPSNKGKPEDMPEAHRINNLYLEGRTDELPYEGMMRTTIVAEARRMVLLENGPDSFDIPLSVMKIGPVALVGIPGEPFTGIGRGLKATEGFDMIIPCCLANGGIGYFPMRDSYDEGGYEARTSKFKAGVAEFIIEEGQKLLTSIK